MPPKKTPTEREKQEQFIAEARRSRQDREAQYRERSLRLYPHICARCGREFAGKKLRELTVHHKDHDHDNNPPDGSNWELLCLYCHDQEHQKYLEADSLGSRAESGAGGDAATFKPFAALADLLKGKKE